VIHHHNHDRLLVVLDRFSLWPGKPRVVAWGGAIQSNQQNRANSRDVWGQTIITTEISELCHVGYSEGQLESDAMKQIQSIVEVLPGGRLQSKSKSG
jgi:hypothetical protein